MSTRHQFKALERNGLAQLSFRRISLPRQHLVTAVTEQNSRLASCMVLYISHTAGRKLAWFLLTDGNLSV